MKPMKKSKTRVFFDELRWARRSIQVLSILCLLTSASLVNAEADAKQAHGKGLNPHSPEQLKKIEQTWPRIVGVRPNKIGVQRIQEHLKSKGLEAQELVPAHPEEELITVVGQSKSLESLPLTALPSNVDNSTLASFPPIGDQQSEGSCVAWASTYYQASHEIGLLNGNNNKTSNTHVLSPKWTYNLLNGGVDGGLIFDDAYILLAQNGAPSISSFPYVNGDFTSWDLNPQDWIAAISNRMAPAQYVAGIGGQTQNLTAIKQLLTNGHIVPFATFIDSWVFTHILSDPSNPNSPYVGQYACTYMNGTAGSHFINIIGYDDNIWIDVNGNGQVDAGERGAFLVANSWGTSWANSGYTWISYDAFLNQSAVVNGPSANRVAAASVENNYVFAVVPKAANYSPSIVGQFSLTQSLRNQISIKAGISNPSQTSPTQIFNCYALMNQGGPLKFNGTVGGPGTKTFAVDMTDLLGSATGTERYYLVTGDNTPGNPTILTAYALLDLVNNKQVKCTGLPLQVDNGQIAPYIDYAFNGIPNQPPVVNITSPANNATVQGTITVAANASSNIGISHVDFYVGSVLKQSDTAAPYLYQLDTTQLSNSLEELSALAYDTNGNGAQSNILVTVNNSGFTPIGVDCGGAEYNYNGIDFKADYGYTTPSSTYANNTITFANLVYNTVRYGSTFGYNFSVPNGNYQVGLDFAEIFFQHPNQRVFNVNINGVPKLTHLDIYAVAGYGVPYLTTFPITVTNGTINISFTSVIDNAQINAIQIAQSH
jgi:C1A family cysteine protease